MPDLIAHPSCKGCVDERGRYICDGTKCAEWKSRVPVLGRKDWPACPIGMTRAPGWREPRDVYLASKVSHLADFPDGYVAGAVDVFVDIKQAVGDEEKRQVDNAKKSADAGKGGR